MVGRTQHSPSACLWGWGVGGPARMMRGGDCRNKDEEAGGGVSPTMLSSVTIPFVAFYQAADTQAEWQRQE